MSESEKAHWGDWAEGDNSMLTVDDSEKQRLWIRVGPVFTDKGADKIPGIWIEYQEKSMASPMQGPLLISPATWEKIKEHVDSRLKNFKESNYKPNEESP